MKHNAISIRTFIGAIDFNESRRFYNELGFVESIISSDMSYFKVYNTLGFYLQAYYIKDWANNSMIFLEVDNVERYWNELQQLGLHNKYKNVKLTSIKNNDWGRECFLHDPAGVLWHFGEFYKPK